MKVYLWTIWLKNRRNKNFLYVGCVYNFVCLFMLWDIVLTDVVLCKCGRTIFLQSTLLKYMDKNALCFHSIFPCRPEAIPKSPVCQKRMPQVSLLPQVRLESMQTFLQLLPMFCTSDRGLFITFRQPNFFSRHGKIQGLLYKHCHDSSVHKIVNSVSKSHFSYHGIKAPPRQKTVRKGASSHKRDQVAHRAQRDSIRSQTIHTKGKAYVTTKYQTFLTKYGIVCPFERTFVNSRGTAYHIL